MLLPSIILRSVLSSQVHIKTRIATQRIPNDEKLMAESGPSTKYKNIVDSTIKQINTNNTMKGIFLKCEITPTVMKRKPTTSKILFNTSNISEKLISAMLLEIIGIIPDINHKIHPRMSTLYRECFDSINKSIETANPINRMNVRMRRLRKTRSCNSNHLLFGLSSF